MAFPASFIDELVARNPIEDVVGQYVSLRRAGANMFGLCPFHGEKTASFSVAPDKGIYYCFGCHKGGGVINFQMEVEGLSYPDAVRALAKRAGMAVPEDEQYQSRYQQQERLWALHKEAARFFHSTLSTEEARVAREYLDKRRLSPETVKHFGLGYAPDRWDSLVKHMKAKGFTEAELVSFDLARKTSKGGTIDNFRNRLMFPIIDLRGNVIAFGGRVLDDSKPKYLNSSDTVVYKKSQALYALNLAKNNPDRRLILCEGYMDVIAMHQAGFTNAVAGLGTAFTKEQISLLVRYCDELTLCFDSDEAGKKATKRALAMLSESPLKLKIMHLADGKDPDEIIKTQGKERMKNIISSAVNDTEFALNDARSRYDISKEDGKLGFLNEAVAVLAGISNAIERDLYTSKLASELEVEKKALELQIRKQLNFSITVLFPLSFVLRGGIKSF